MASLTPLSSLQYLRRLLPDLYLMLISDLYLPLYPDVDLNLFSINFVSTDPFVARLQVWSFQYYLLLEDQAHGLQVAKRGTTLHFDCTVLHHILTPHKE